MPQAAEEPRPGWASREGIVDAHHATSAAGENIDRAAIFEVLSRLALFCDERNQYEIADCFCEDVTLVGNVGGASSLGTFRGKSDVSKWLSSRSVAGQRRHLIANPVLEDWKFNRAVVICSLIVTIATNNLCRMLSTGILRANLRTDDHGIWQIDRLVVGLDTSC
jgi:hypothetical protein